MARDVASELERQGYRARIVPIARLRDLERLIEDQRRGGPLAEGAGCKA